MQRFHFSKKDRSKRKKTEGSIAELLYPHAFNSMGALFHYRHYPEVNSVNLKDQSEQIVAAGRKTL